MTRRAALFLSLFILAACRTATVPPQAAQQPVHVVVVATTDVHGWFNGHQDVAENGLPPARYGGLALLSSYVDALRQANGGNVVLVDSGDMFQGTLESNLFEGEAVVRGYNKLGYAAAAVGNHEFDYGPVGPAAVPRNPGDDPLGALKHNASLATFPLLSANMLDKTTGQVPAWAKPYRMVTVGGVKIGIVGLSTPDTPNVTMRANVMTLDFTEPVAALVANAQELRRQGAAAVIAIAHIGGRCNDVSDTHSLASCDRAQEAMQLLETLPPGTIDGFFGGHTHAQMRQFVNGTPAAQALAYSREFSTLDLWVDPASNHVVTDRTVIRPPTMICAQVFAGTETCDPKRAPKGSALVPRVFEGKTIAPDPAMNAIFAPYLAKVDVKRNEKLGITTTAPFKRNYAAESTLGDLLADSLRDAMGADIGFFNSGGIRTDLRAGDLVYGDIFEVSPFDNYPAVVTMTGAQVGEAIRLSSSGDRGLMQVSGIKYTVDLALDREKPADQRNRVVTLTLTNGEPLDPSRLYRVAMPDFIATGGDGLLPLVSKLPANQIVINQDRPIREVVIEALQKRGKPVAPATEGRVTILHADGSAN